MRGLSYFVTSVSTRINGSTRALTALHRTPRPQPARPINMSSGQPNGVVRASYTHITTSRFLFDVRQPAALQQQPVSQIQISYISWSNTGHTHRRVRTPRQRHTTLHSFLQLEAVQARLAATTTELAGQVATLGQELTTASHVLDEKLEAECSKVGRNVSLEVHTCRNR